MDGHVAEVKRRAENLDLGQKFDPLAADLEGRFEESPSRRWVRSSTVTQSQPIQKSSSDWVRRSWKPGGSRSGRRALTPHWGHMVWRDAKDATRRPVLAAIAASSSVLALKREHRP